MSSAEKDLIEEKFELAFGAEFNVPDDVDLASAGTTERVLWSEAVALQGKQYELPDGRVGTRFVHMLADELERLAAGRQNSERVFLFSMLVLQRDKMVKKGRDIRPLVTRRLDLWEAGELRTLLREAQRCDRQFAAQPKPMEREQLERTFNRLVLQGRVRAAVRLLTDRSGTTVLDPDAEALGKSGPLGKTCFDVLCEKHPQQRPPDASAFVECDELPSREFVHITSAHVETVARRLQGGAGPSGTDAEQWRSFLLRYGKASERMREAVASLTRRHANEVVPWASIRALAARRGIALDKQPGVRPIGVGECLQRLEAKAMALVTGMDAADACGADQLCAGVKAGIEAAVHAMRDVFHDDDTEAVLLIDASNAFNSISRPALLWNCRVLWPRCSTFLFNFYRGSPLIIVRSLRRGTPSVLCSREGTTQGCPLSMMAYAVGILPLIRQLKCPPEQPLRTQIWYADDSSCGGKLLKILQWFTQLMELGPAYGYFVEASKSVLVVKEAFIASAKELFGPYDVKIELANRFLGGCVGQDAGVRAYVGSKIDVWVEAVKIMARAATTYPQSVYAAFTKSLSMEWTYLQRVIDGCDDMYVPLRDAIRGYLTPALLGREILQDEYDLFALPVKNGGLALRNPAATAATSFRMSTTATTLLQHAIRTGSPADMGEHNAQCRRVQQKAQAEARDRAEVDLKVLLNKMPATQQRTLSRIVHGNASTWLTVLPLSAEGFDLSATQFRDQLAIRYHRQPVGLPSLCDGCGADFTLQHALDCRKGGLVRKGHDYLRDHDAGLASQAWGSVRVEPVVLPAHEQQDRPELRADWMALGVWESGRAAFFDERIIDADAPSYSNLSWETIANTAVRAKKAKYARAAEELRSSFTPLVCSTDGVLHTEYTALLRRVATQLANKWQRPYAMVMAWVKARTQFAIIRAVDLRLRGSRSRCLGLRLQDGAPLGELCSVPLGTV